MTDILDLNVTPASNTSLDSIDIQGSAPVSNFDGALRGLLSILKLNELDRAGANTVAGTADVITITASRTVTQYIAGSAITFIAGGDNTVTGVTVNIDSVGAKKIKKAIAGVESILAIGDIQDGGLYSLVYRTSWESAAGAFQLVDMNEIGSLASANNLSDLASAGTARTNLGLAYGQETIYAGSGAWSSPTTNGAASSSEELATNDIRINYLAFDATTEEAAFLMFQAPKSWDAGTLTLQPIWTHPAATTYGVVWGFSARAYADGDALDQAMGSAETSTDTGGTTSDCYIGPECSPITVAGSPAGEQLIIIKVSRVVADGSDTCDVDAHLLGVKIHYTVNAGSDT